MNDPVTCWGTCPYCCCPYCWSYRLLAVLLLAVLLVIPGLLAVLLVVAGRLSAILAGVSLRLALRLVCGWLGGSPYGWSCGWSGSAGFWLSLMPRNICRPLGPPPPPRWGRRWIT